LLTIRGLVMKIVINHWRKKQMENQILNILKRLEELRRKINNGEIQEGSSDWLIRICEAEVAQGFFETRTDWTDLLNKKN